MYTIQTKTLNKLSHQAAALVAYAETNSEFANILYTYTKQFINLQKPTTVVTPSPYLFPIDTETAAVRTWWLMQEITLLKPKKTEEAQAVLATWAKNYEAPKDLVLGIVGLAIIGPTLGLIKKRKKGKSQMKVILNQHELKQSQKYILDLILEASTGLLGNELAAVSGQANRLDPELADWLFAEHDTATSNATDREIQKILTDLQAESLPHFVTKRDNAISAIAIAPSVSYEFLANRDTE